MTALTENFFIPPLFDHHSHFTLYSTLGAMPSISEAENIGNALEIIKDAKTGKVTVVSGWKSSRYNITPADLGDENPVIVLNLSLHGIVMNRAAEDFLAQDYIDIVRNYTKSDWTEKNLTTIFRMIAAIVKHSPGALLDYAESLKSSGISCMEEMCLPAEQWIDAMKGLAVNIESWADEKIYGKLSPAALKAVKGVKLFTDGALGTRTAALSRPFVSGENGILLMKNGEFTEKLYGYMKQGIPVAVHAIGDVAVDQVVNAVKFNRRERGCGGPVRIEHAQFITEESAFTARDEGISLSMQPNFSFDSVMYADRLPEGFADLNNPFRMLIDKAGFVPGKDLVFGSDGMPHGMQHAIQSSLFPPFKGQVLTFDEFTRGYCSTNAESVWQVVIKDGTVEVRRAVRGGL